MLFFVQQTIVWVVVGIIFQHPVSRSSAFGCSYSKEPNGLRFQNALHCQTDLYASMAWHQSSIAAFGVHTIVAAHCILGIRCAHFVSLYQDSEPAYKRELPAYSNCQITAWAAACSSPSAKLPEDKPSSKHSRSVRRAAVWWPRFKMGLRTPGWNRA